MKPPPHNHHVHITTTATVIIIIIKLTVYVADALMQQKTSHSQNYCTI
jgi:hypothetical protein